MSSEHDKISDPEALREFAKRLRDFNKEIQSIKGNIGALLVELGKTWSDDQYKAFKKAFEAVCMRLEDSRDQTDKEMNVLKTLADVLDRHIETMNRKPE